MDPLVAESGVPGESVLVDVGDVRLHAVLAGPDDGPLAVLLHGFPECWYGWHRQIRPLVEAGYRVAVPDQRGYNRSDKPEGVSAYGLDRLAGDVVGLLDALGRERAHLVGHDWGAAVAWWTALHRPDRLATLAAVNVPHPSVMARHLRHDWGQRLRSWYFLYLQVPALPERLARVGDYAPLVRTMRTSSNPGTFSATDFRRYRRAWRQPGALTASMNWYRAVGRQRPRPAREIVTVPTVVLWGVGDRFLETAMARESAVLCDDGRVRFVDGATHWVQHERPGLVADELLAQFERG
ncbi:MAG: alpha/beta fold hydrolase [Haloferacaceae archaeon]